MKEEIKVAKSHNILVGIAPTFMSLDVVGNNKSEDLILSAQNVNEHASGAYTGEVSISMLQEVKGLLTLLLDILKEDNTIKKLMKVVMLR